MMKKYIILFNLAVLVAWGVFSLGLYAHGTLDDPTFFSNWVVMNILVGAALVMEAVLLVGFWWIDRSEED